jgi:hypothetical protein
MSQGIGMTLTQLRDAVAALEGVEDTNRGVGPYVRFEYVANDSDDLRVTFGDWERIVPTRRSPE